MWLAAYILISDNGRPHLKRPNIGYFSRRMTDETALNVTACRLLYP